MENYASMQNWVEFIVSPWWVKGFGMIGIFWLLMQLLPPEWAGGRLFRRRGFWVSSSIAALVVFVVFVLPWITWQLILGTLGVAAFVGLAVWARTWEKE